MVKEQVIRIRVESEQKERLEQAARTRGLTMTQFILDSAEKVASQTRTSASKAFGGVPSFFKALCWTARKGGAAGYSMAGYELARNIGGLQPDGMDEDEWEARLESLTMLVMPTQHGEHGIGFIQRGVRDDDATAAWFSETFPKCMALVPKRRVPQFVAGVYQAFDDEVVDY